MAKYRRKEVVIDAALVSDLIYAFEHDWKALPDWAHEAYEAGVIVALTHGGFTIKTRLGGELRAFTSDWVIRDDMDNLYPVSINIFHAAYEAVDA